MKGSSHIPLARPLVLDGAMGTELARRGYDTSLPLWSARPMLANPGVIVAIHREYIERGADVITANTFRTNVRAFREGGLTGEDARTATHLAIQCARRAVDEVSTSRPVAIAASMAPVCDCYHPERVPDPSSLRAEHGALARWLVEVGVALVLVETMNTIREASAAIRAAVETGMEVWASFLCGENPTELLSGEPLVDAILTALELGASAVGVNCIPRSFVPQCIRLIRSVTDRPILVYPNGGVVSPNGAWGFDGALTTGAFATLCRLWLELGARIIGGCCGTGPAHTESARLVVDKWGVDA